MTLFDQMRIEHFILPVIVIEVSILTFLGTKNTFSSFSKFKMAVTYKKIQNGRQNDEYWPNYSYDIIHHQSFELRYMCVSF